MVKTLTPEELRKLTRADLLARKKALATEIRKQGEAYDARRKNNEAAWPDESRASWESINKDYDENEKALIEANNDDEIRNRMTQIHEDENRSTRFGQPKPGLDDRIPGENRTYGDAGFDRDEAREFARRQKERQLMFRAFLLSDEAPEAISDEMHDACTRNRFNFSTRQINVPLMDTVGTRNLKRFMARMSADERAFAVESGEIRALSSVTANAGPELIPASFVNILSMAMVAYGDMLAYVDTMVTETGEPTSWTIGDDGTNEGAWVGTEGEDTQVIGEPNPAFLRQTWNAYELHSKWVKVPYTLSEDSMFNLEFELAKILGERLGRARNTAATTGNGTGKSKGIVLDAPLGVTAAAATAISYDDVVKLEHSVDPAYRNESMFMLHDNVIQALRLIKDSQGRPLWQSSMREGVPDRINNRPYTYNQAMASTVATTNVTMLFGRLKDYKERVVRNMRLVKAVERFAEKLQNGYLGYMRVDGKLQRPSADARVSVKKLVQA